MLLVACGMIGRLLNFWDNTIRILQDITRCGLPCQTIWSHSASDRKSIEFQCAKLCTNKSLVYSFSMNSLLGPQGPYIPLKYKSRNGGKLITMKQPQMKRLVLGRDYGWDLVGSLHGRCSD